MEVAAGRGDVAVAKSSLDLWQARAAADDRRAITHAFEKPAIGEASVDVRFSIAVAAFAQLLRSEPHPKSFG
jgi:hypothetical protein